MAAVALDDVPDEALMIAFANGDREAARHLTLRLTPRAYRMAARLLGDRTEAEDVAQEAMLRLWRVAPEWRQDGARVTTWLYRVVSNLVTDRLRRRGTVDLDAIDEPADERPGVEAMMTRAARMRALDRALQRLPERQRLAVVLRHIEGASNPAIAEVLGISVEAVESLTARGKRALAAHLVGQREELGFGDD